MSYPTVGRYDAPILITLLTVACGAFLCVMGLLVRDVYRDWTNPCIKYEQRWQEAHTDILLLPNGQGGNTPMPVFREAKWARVCVERKGDR